MKTIHRPTLNEFIQKAKPFLERDLFGNVLSIRLTNRLENGDYPDHHLFVITEDTSGDICATAIQTAPHNIILSTGNCESFTALVQWISGTNFPFPGINGPEDSTSAFASAWNAINSNNTPGVVSNQKRTLTPALRLQYYVLDQIESAGIANGQARLAIESDLPMLNKWREEFGTEVGLSEAERKPAPERVAMRVENSEIMLWEDQGHPVCMVWGTLITNGIMSIGAVYTPLQYRGHRYASACVTEISRQILSAGNRAVLCADMANPTSNAIYQRIGYHEKSIYAEYRF